MRRSMVRPTVVLPAARFTHQSKRLALSDKETHIIDCLDLIDNALKQAGAHREIFHQVVDFHQHFPVVIVIRWHVECSSKKPRLTDLKRSDMALRVFDITSSVRGDPA